MQPTEDKTRSKHPWFVAILVAIVSSVFFIPTLSNDFVYSWDDGLNFTENSDFGGLSLERLSWIASTRILGVWQPVAWFLLCAQFSIAGLQPWIYHLSSIVMHAGIAVVFFFLIIRVLQQSTTGSHQAMIWAAASASMLMAVHPLRVEAVAWVSCQPYLPAIFFYILAVHVYLGQGSRLSIRRLLCVLLLYALAVMSKAAAVSLPAILLIVDIYPLRRLPAVDSSWMLGHAKRVWLEKLPFLAIALGVSMMAMLAKREAESLVSFDHYGLAERLAQAAYGLCFYVSKTLIPHGLSAYYALPESVQLSDTRFVVSGLMTILAVGFAVVLRRKWLAFSIAVLSYIVILSPTSHLVRIGSQIAADRYGYLSTMALFVLLAAGLTHLYSSRSQWLKPTVLAVCLTVLSLGTMTWKHCKHWNNSFTLWTRALEVDPHTAWPYNNLGNYYTRQGDFEQAVEHLVRARQLDERLPQIPFNLGVAYDKQGDIQQAYDQYRTALNIQPRFFKAHNNLGVLLMNAGKLTESEAHLRQALKIRPDDIDALYNLGNTLIRMGAFRAATETLDRCLAKQPDHHKALTSRGSILHHQQDIAQAIPYYDKAIDIEPDYAEAQNNLAIAYSQLGNHKQATVHFRRAVQLMPASHEVHTNLATAYLEQDMLELAIDHYRTALEIKPDYSVAQSQLQRALSQQGGTQ